MSLQIAMTPVESSQIAAIGHDGATSKLAVKFKKGTVYEYSNVPVELHTRLMAAPSVGKFFSAEIKAFPETYPFTQVS